MGLARERVEIRAPRADVVAVLPSHAQGDLAEMVQIVHSPGRKELSGGDAPEGGVRAGAGDVCGREVQSFERCKALGAAVGELVEQIGEGCVRGLGWKCIVGERVKWAGLAKLEDSAKAGDPVIGFGEDEMSDNLAWRPGGRAVGVVGPGGLQAAEKCVEDAGCSTEDVQGMVKREHGERG